MVRDVYDVIHAANYAALCIAILRPIPTTVEDAFALYDGEKIRRGYRTNHLARVKEMKLLRDDGYTWREIGQALGLKHPQCFYSRYRHLLNNNCEV